jgi:hypothetical protein
MGVLSPAFGEKLISVDTTTPTKAQLYSVQQGEAINMAW